MPIELDGIALEHRINPRLKHAYLTVQADGSVLLKSNGRGLRQLQRFVESKREWIEQQRRHQRSRPRMELGCTILLNALLIPLENLEGFAFDTRSETAARRSYDRFYRERAEAVLTDRTVHFAEEMGLSFKTIRFRKMKRRWGSCSKEGVITYNTLLMQLPPELVDYTVVHELAHRCHFNHSAAFHAAVRKILPDEKELRAKMRHLTAAPY